MATGVAQDWTLLGLELLAREGWQVRKALKNKAEEAQRPRGVRIRVGSGVGAQQENSRPHMCMRASILALPHGECMLMPLHTAGLPAHIQQLGSQ